MEKRTKIMKNIILQHWSGQLQSWAVKCKNSVEKYAEQSGADYEFLEDYPMGDFFKNKNTKPFLVVQKIHMISEKYDDYDNVLMLDMDMLATKHFDNIFDYEGIGRLHKKGMKAAHLSKNGRKWPKLYKQGFPMFFGNCVKFGRQDRIAMRKCLDRDILNKGMSDDGLPPNDEIIMHYLMHTAGILKDKKVLELPHERFCDLPEEAHPKATFLHYCGSRKNQIR